MNLHQEFEEAMAVHNGAEAAAWMAGQIERLLAHWQHDGFGREQARQLICINLGYMAAHHGREAQRRVFDLYGALHPMVLMMSEEERKDRQFVFEFSDAELFEAAARWRGRFGLPAAPGR